MTTYLAAVVGSSPENEFASVYRFNRIWSEIDTLDRKTAEESRMATGIGYRENKVKVMLFDELIQKIGYVNFLNVDVEGLDKEIILRLRPDLGRPDVIVFEDGVCWGGSIESIEHLKRLGYVHLFTSGGSIGYCLPLTTAG